MTGKPIDYVLSKFDGPRRNGAGWKCRCPAHDDHKPSLSIDEGEDGTVLVKCRANCETSAVLAAVGLTLRDLFPTANGKPKDDATKPKSSAFPSASKAVASIEKQKGKRSALWTYTDAGGEPVGVVVRWDTDGGKDIRPVSRYPDGWRVAAMPSPRPLYRLPELASAKTVVVCEGEKSVDCAVKLGFTATTSAGGSGAPSISDWTALAGKTVLIVPDNDAPGRKYADAVAAILAKLSVPAVVKIVELPGLPERGDIVDYVATRPDAKPDDLRAEIEDLAKTTTPKAAPPDPNAWDAPTPLPERPPVPPFPVHLFPPAVRDWWEARADRVNIPLDTLGTLGVAALGTAIGRALAGEIVWGYSRSAIVWVGAVDISGTGKTTATDTVLDVLRDWDLEKSTEFAAAMKTYEDAAKCHKQAMKDWEAGGRDGEMPEAPVPPVHAITVIENITLETLPGLLKDNPKGAGILRDEFGSLLLSLNQYKSGGAGSDRAEYLRLWSGEGTFSSTRGGAGERSHKIAPHCYLSMGGCMTPADAVQFATGTVDGKGTRHDGFAERFLISWPDPRRAVPLRRMPSIKDVKDAYESFVRRLLTIPMKQVVKQIGVDVHVSLKPHTITATAAAFDEWNRNDVRKCDTQNALDLNDPFRGWISKMSNNALAFSTMFFALEQAEKAQAEGRAIPVPLVDEIEERHVAAGWELCWYYYGHALRVWGNSPLAEQLRRARAILDKLNEHGKKQATWTRRDLHKLVDRQAWAKDKPPSELDKPIALLVEYGYLRAEETPRSGRGRPTERFELCPLAPAIAPKKGGDNPGDGPEREKPRENATFDPTNIAPNPPETVEFDGADIPDAGSLENKAKTNGEPGETNFAPQNGPYMDVVSPRRKRTFGPAKGTAAKGGRA